jgi:A/G-specific adenine glycosylase
MLKGRRLPTFRKRLLDWFQQNRRDLPWRRTQDPYRIWLSEIMLQQTRVAAVIPYFERFLERFPHVQALAAAPEEQVLRFWSGLGYYNRARNLQRAARKILAEHGGEFPVRLEEILTLPGVGHYTAAAISSIAFGKKHAVLDGNVARVLARLGAIRGDLRASGRWRKLQETAATYLDPGTPGDWNQAMMELGATLCAPKAPQCLLCPVAQFCQARKRGIVELLPEKRQKRAPAEIHLAAAVFADEHGRTLLLPPPQGPNGGAMRDSLATLVSNLWHFPTTAVSGNAVRKLRHHLGKLKMQRQNGRLDFLAGQPVHHTVTYRTITVEPFRIHVKKLPHIRGAEQVPLSEITVLPVSNLTRKVAQAALVPLASPLRKA